MIALRPDWPGAVFSEGFDLLHITQPERITMPRVTLPGDGVAAVSSVSARAMGKKRKQASP